MLPKMTKNLFRDKAKQVSSTTFNFKTFLMGVFFVGTTAMAGVSVPTALEMDNLIKEQFVRLGLSVSYDGIWFVKRKYD